MVWAAGGSPRLILPVRLWDGLDPGQRDALLVHELAHLRRRDHWVRLLEAVVTALYWWHPAVWWARRELHESEERCCDAWVVGTLPGVARSYASALLATVDFLSEVPSPLPVGASGLGRGGHFQHLRRRLTLIMGGTQPRALTRSALLAVLLLGIVTMPLSVIRARTTSPEIAGAKELLWSRRAMPANPEVRWSVVDSNSGEPGAKVVLLKVQSQKSDNARESLGARAP